MTSKQPLDRAAESALVARCKQRSAEAFGEIVDAYQQRLFGFVRRMAGAEDVDDVVQEVFVRAYQALDRFDGRSSLSTWLFRIAYNLCIDRKRQSDRTRTEFRLDDTPPGEEPFELLDTRWNPERIVLQSELHEAVERAIRTLSDKLRAVLLLHDREDMDYEQIAGALKIPVGTVKSRLFLARAHIQREVRSYLSEDQR